MYDVSVLDVWAENQTNSHKLYFKCASKEDIIYKGFNPKILPFFRRY